MSKNLKAMEMLFVSKVRIKVLKLFFLDPEVPLHLRAIVRETKEEINSVRRELSRLEECKILESEKRGNRKYFMLSRFAPFYKELKGIIFKTYGLGGSIIRSISKLGDVNYAILTQNYIDGSSNIDHPIDFVIIGKFTEFSFYIRKKIK